MDNVFEISVISPPDREFLTAEIMVGAEQRAELHQEGGVLSVESYPRPDKQPWCFRYEAAVDALSKAKQLLVAA